MALMMLETSSRYNRVAISLHWLMAVAFFWMLASGSVMANLELSQSLKFQLYQWHKSTGVLLLLTAVLRLLWRLFSRPPPLPNRFSQFDQRAAKAGHWGLYVLMFLMPLSGWLMVSASIYGLPTIVFGWFEWPHIPDLQGDKAIESQAKTVHFFGAIGFASLIAIHLFAVVKHARKDGENLLTRMWWLTPK